jgi:hypothetical protein
MNQFRINGALVVCFTLLCQTSAMLYAKTKEVEVARPAADETLIYVESAHKL